MPMRDGLGRGIHTVKAESAACEACARFAGRVPGPRRCLPPSLGVDLGIKDLQLLLDLRKLLLQVAQRHLVRAIVRLLRAPFDLGIWGVGRWMVGRWCAHSRVARLIGSIRHVLRHVGQNQCALHVVVVDRALPFQLHVELVGHDALSLPVGD